MAQTIPLKDIVVGDRRALTVESRLLSSGADKNPTSATMLVYDPELKVTGTADAGGTSTLSDSALTQASDYWNGMPIEVTDATDDHMEETEVTDFDATLDMLTFGTLSFAVVADDTYTIKGTPVLTEAAATVSGNEASRIASPSDVTARPRALTVPFEFTFSADDIQGGIGLLQVIPRRLVP